MVDLTDRQQRFLARVAQVLENHVVETPGLADLARELGAPVQAVKEILRLGAEEGQVFRVEDGLYYTSAQLDQIEESLRNVLVDREFGQKEFRVALGTNRRYADALWSFFCEQGLLVPTGNGRRLRDGPKCSTVTRIGPTDH